MSAEKSTAIVLKVVDFSETSCVTTLLTREFGKVSALAKGARRPKSPFEAALDVLSICRVVFLRKSGDSLHLLTEAKLDRRFRAGSRSLKRLYTGYYVIELLSKMTDDLDPQPDLYDMAVKAISELDSGSTEGSEDSDEVVEILLRFQMQMLTTLGHVPSFRECVECGKVVEGKRVPFGMNSGGVFCPTCRDGKRQVVSLSQPALAGLIQFATANEDWQTNDSKKLPLGEMSGLIDQYITHLLGNKPRMLQFFQSVSTR